MNSGSVSETEISQAVGQVTDPEIRRSLGELRMVKSAKFAADGSVAVEIELPTPAYPDRERITAAVAQALQNKFPQIGKVSVSYSHVVKGLDTGGAIGLRAKNVIAVGSGKGGVGKSTVAACLAYGLQEYGARVGLMDADVYGPSIPHLLGITGKPSIMEETGPGGETINRIVPMVADGVKCISMGFFIEPDKAVVWRGPLLHRAITQFLKDTDWGELDYLIIDLPPGTGDVSLTLSQLLGLAGAVVVCSPQQVALLDAVKAISMYRQVKIPVLGMVENMSGEIFGRGGARNKAAELGVPFLGEIPMEAQIRIQGDAGKISALFKEDNPARPYLRAMCEQTAMQIARQLLQTPRLPTLEIL
ncbi:MAG: Mrp/NBP35 family ATP-binding protein [Planctomycetaceae bacterium]